MRHTSKTIEATLFLNDSIIKRYKYYNRTCYNKCMRYIKPDIAFLERSSCNIFIKYIIASDCLVNYVVKPLKSTLLLDDYLINFKSTLVLCKLKHLSNVE